MNELFKEVTKVKAASHAKLENSREAYVKSISVYASKLLEEFQWNTTTYDREAVKDALAEVVGYALLVAESLELDLKTLLEAKLEAEKKFIK